MDAWGPTRLFKACEDVYEEFMCEGMQPGSERWIEDSRTCFPMLRDAVYRKWHSGLPSGRFKSSSEFNMALFPWSDDAIRRAFTAYRKTRNERRESEVDE